MISDTVVVADHGNECAGLHAALEMVQKMAAFSGYADREVALLARIADEMITGSAAILDLFTGSMWVETDDAMFSIVLKMEGTFTQDARERFIALTKDNKNTLPEGFFARLGVLLGNALTGEYAFPMGLSDAGVETYWSASQIAEMMVAMDRHDPQDEALQKEAKQALDSLADDVIVTAKSDEMTITAKKALPRKA